MRIRNQTDHRREYFERLAAGKVQQNAKPRDKTRPRIAPVRPAATDANGKPMTLAEQLGIVRRDKQKRRVKPKKRIKAPVTLTPDKPQAAPSVVHTPDRPVPEDPQPAPPASDVPTVEPVVESAAVDATSQDVPQDVTPEVSQDEAQDAVQDAPRPEALTDDFDLFGAI